MVGGSGVSGLPPLHNNNQVYSCVPVLVVAIAHAWGTIVFGAKMWGGGTMCLLQSRILAGHFYLLCLAACVSWRHRGGGGWGVRDVDAPTFIETDGFLIANLSYVCFACFEAEGTPGRGCPVCGRCLHV